MAGKSILMMGMLCSTYGAYSGNSIGQLVLAHDTTRKENSQRALIAQRVHAQNAQAPSVASCKGYPYQVKLPIQRQTRCKN